MIIVPKKFFFTSGVGTHEKPMRAFEQALRGAGVQHCNLVKISSIIPPDCVQISREEGLALLKPGQVTFAVRAEAQTNEPGQLIGGGIGMAHPKDNTMHGYLTEVEEAIGREEDDIEQDVIEMAIENLVTDWGHKFDGEDVFRKGKKNYELYNHEVRVDSIVQTAKGAEGNLYTVVFVGAIFIL